MQRRVFLALGMVLCLVAVAQATPSINVGAHTLAANTPGQQVQIFVTGGDAVAGLSMNAQVADGGPGAGGSIVGPGITSGDILTGAIFGPNNTGQVDVLGGAFGNQILVLTTTTANGTVPANGLLVTLTFDTTGFNSGSWPLIMAGTLNGNSDFGPVAAAITDGSITILPQVVTPEPGSIVLGLFAVAGLGAVAVRKHRARRVA